MLINHRQSSTAFVCFLSEENNLAFGVHRPMLPSSIKIVRKLVELTEQYLLIILCGYCQHSGKCHKKVKLLPRPSFSILYARNKKIKRKRGAGYPRLAQACPNLTLSMRVFGPGNSAYAFNLTYDRHTPIIIQRFILSCHKLLFPLKFLI